MARVTLLETYKKEIGSIEAFKQRAMQHIVSIIKTINVHPLCIGNMMYFYTQYKGKEVPAYCYVSDYKQGGEKAKFLPIYDEDETCEFGWCDFEQCCRIFDVIEKKLFNIED